jgi:hypothetical protein
LAEEIAVGDAYRQLRAARRSFVQISRRTFRRTNALNL